MNCILSNINLLPESEYKFQVSKNVHTKSWVLQIVSMDEENILMTFEFKSKPVLYNVVDEFEQATGKTLTELF